MRALFHLAYNVDDLDAARTFYIDVLGCTEGRSAPTWVDFDFYGHQLSLHRGQPFPTAVIGRVGEQLVPMPHLGLILPLEDWRALADRLTVAGITFVIPPTVRYENEPGEQWTMFFRDPAENSIKIKGFRDFGGVFAS